MKGENSNRFSMEELKLLDWLSREVSVVMHSL